MVRAVTSVGGTRPIAGEFTPIVDRTAGVAGIEEVIGIMAETGSFGGCGGSIHGTSKIAKRTNGSGSIIADRQRPVIRADRAGSSTR